MVYRFSHFTFDSKLHELRRGREFLSIRPKTTQVLDYLLENRQRVVTKQELFTAVWGHDCVEDHALFQELPAQDCSNSIKRQFELARSLRPTGTPAVITESGQMIHGYVPPDRLAAELGLTTAR